MVRKISEEHLQSSNETMKTKQKRQKERNKIPPKDFDIFPPLWDAQKVQMRSDCFLNTKHMPEKDKRRALDRL